MSNSQTTDLVPGQTFLVRDGMTITPQMVRVTVAWADEHTVWYRKQFRAEMLETPRSRFLEIVRPVTNPKPPHAAAAVR